MIIEENPIEKQAMKAFHEGFREEGLKLQEKLFLPFAGNMPKKTIVPARKPAAITAIVKNVWRSTGPTANTFPTVCSL